MQTLDQLGSKADQANSSLGQINGKSDTLLSKAESRTAISSLPFTISAPGSYYLTANLIASSGSAGITIAVDNVTLDLNGFELIGGGSGTVSGINVPSAQKNISIRNGTVRGWTNGGVHADNASNSLFERLRVSDNSGTLGGGSAGLTIGPGSMARDCVAQGNGNIYGIRTYDGCTVLDCTATSNGDHGFYVGNNCTIVDSTASANSGAGMYVFNYSIVARCTSTGNSGHVPLPPPGGNKPTGNGIQVGFGCTVVNCTVASNQIDGIRADFGSTVRDCTARNNDTERQGSAGIEVTAGCHVTGNTCDANVGAGIEVSGDHNRIEGNSCTFNNIPPNGGGYGIWIIGDHNVIFRNTASGNAGSDYKNIGSGNVIGDIIDMSAGGTVTTSEAWANFKY